MANTSGDFYSADKLSKSKSNNNLGQIKEEKLNKTPQSKGKIQNEYKTMDNTKQYNMTPE